MKMTYHFFRTPDDLDGDADRLTQLVRDAERAGQLRPGCLAVFAPKLGHSPDYRLLNPRLMALYRRLESDIPLLPRWVLPGRFTRDLFFSGVRSLLVRPNRLLEVPHYEFKLTDLENRVKEWRAQAFAEMGTSSALGDRDLQEQWQDLLAEIPFSE